MKISNNWLKEYIDSGLSPQELSTVLTNTGLEVEALEQVQAIPDGLQGLVIGHVESCEPHPNADRLRITKVNIGNGEALQIVCGAPNVAKGQNVVVATVGTTLYPVSGESFKIKKSKIRGEESSGMICAEDEIGLGESHNGIMVLPGEVKIGMPANEYFKLNDDWVFEIGLTPNRVDAASHIGVAKDVAAVIKSKVNYPSVEAFQPGTDKPVELTVENKEACPRYSALVIEGIEIKESPAWLKDRLQAIGIKCINNVVDITNYVLHETGQPLHAFDLSAVKGNKVIVKTLPNGTIFTSLDKVDRKLSANDLMICDAEKGMCLAGVFGGLHSGVTQNTTRIFLESAYFNPVYIRKTAKRHGLKTDSSFRFERGADPNATVYALKRAALLIAEITGGKVASDLIDHYPEPIKPVQIKFSCNRAKRLIGKSIPTAEIKSILTHLEIQIIHDNGEELLLEIPTAKVDVTREVDVVEEVLRIYGYNNIEIPSKVNASLSYSQQPDPEVLYNSIASFLTDNGFAEIMCNSLDNAEHTQWIGDLEESQNIAIVNPLSSELNVMRQSMLFGGLQAIAHNVNRKSSSLKFYEFGKVYKLVEGKHKESRKLVLYITGRKQDEQWNSGKENVDFYSLKGYIEAIIKKLGLRISSVEDCKKQGLQSGLAAMLGPKQLMCFGTVSDQILTAFEIDQPVFYAELDWDHILNARKKHGLQYAEVPRFPSVRRDLSLLMDKSINFAELEKIAFQSEKKILKKVTIFDKYEETSAAGKAARLPVGKKSYALSFILQDDTATLNDTRIDQVMGRLIENYEKQGIEIRK